MTAHPRPGTDPGEAAGEPDRELNATSSRHRAERPAVEDRGTVRVDPTVVRKIAQHTADATPGTITASRKSRAGGHRSGARVHDRGGTMDIALQVVLRYPASVAEISERLRTNVVDEVSRLTGCHVRRVAVTVTALLPDDQPRVE